MTFPVDSSVLLSTRLFSFISCKPKFLCTSAVRYLMAKSEDAKTTMEISKIPPIVATFRQALRTFDDTNKPQFETNMKMLKQLMDRLSADDLGYNKALNDPSIWEAKHKAPCTYIEVFQNNTVNMCIFVLRPGFKMPMHDHPHMHGMLKVISGAVKIRSFTEYPVTQVFSEMDIVTRAKYQACRLAQGIHRKRRLFAKIETDSVCTDATPACLLTPTYSNFHEIQALDRPAAFFDILAPPYDALTDRIGPRKCSYYFVSNEISTNLVELEETEVPRCFYCDQQPYLGPVLM